MAWVKPAGAWAQDVEDEEAAHGGPLAPPAANLPTRAFPSLDDVSKDDDFPALGAAAPAGGKGGKGGKAGKKKTLTLADFQRTTASGRPAFVPRAGSMIGRGRMTDEQLRMALPTASRGKVEGEEERPLGGAFGDHRRSDGPGRDDEDVGPSRADASDSWGADRRRPAGGFGPGGDRPERRSGFADAGESGRADEVDDWGRGRKFEPSAGGGFGGPRGGGFGARDRLEGGDFGASGRADEVDDWGKGRKFEPGAGGGFGGPRGGGFGARDRPEGGDFGVSGRADEVDDWGKGRKFEPGAASEGRSGGFGAPRGEGPTSDFGVSGKADEVDDWGKNKKFEAGAAAPPAGLGDAARPASDFGVSGKADEVDDWGKNKKFEAGAFAGPGAAARPRSPLEPSRADLEDRWERKAAPPASPRGDGADESRGRSGAFSPRAARGASQSRERGLGEGASRERGFGAHPGKDVDAESSWRRAEELPQHPHHREHRHDAARADASPAREGAAAADREGASSWRRAPGAEARDQGSRYQPRDGSRFQPSRDAARHQAGRGGRREHDAEGAEGARAPAAEAKKKAPKAPSRREELEHLVRELEARTEAGEGDAPLDASAGAGEPGARSVEDSLADARAELEQLALEPEPEEEEGEEEDEEAKPADTLAAKPAAHAEGRYGAPRGDAAQGAAGWKREPRAAAEPRRGGGAGWRRDDAPRTGGW